MENIYKCFDTVQQFDNYIKAGKTQPKHTDEDSLTETSWADWYGTKTFRDAQRLLEYGDSDTARDVYEGVTLKSAAIKRTTRQVRASVTGFAPHVPNAIAGVPCSMIRVNYIPVKTRVLTVVYNISVNGGISAQSMKQAAVTMLSAINTIEAHGTRVNLYVCDLSRWKFHHVGRPDEVQEVGWLLKIKSSTQHLDILKTAYPLCNPAMLRRHSFRFTEITEGIKGRSYGYAHEDTSELCKKCGLRKVVSIAYSEASSLGVEDLSDLILEKAAKVK